MGRPHTSTVDRGRTRQQRALSVGGCGRRRSARARVPGLGRAAHLLHDRLRGNPSKQTRLLPQEGVGRKRACHRVAEARCSCHIAGIPSSRRRETASSTLRRLPQPVTDLVDLAGRQWARIAARPRGSVDIEASVPGVLRALPFCCHAERSVAHLKDQKPRVSGAFVRADEGTRTLDLLHGKQTL
jgi:hypothetical protein